MPDPVSPMDPTSWFNSTVIRAGVVGVVAWVITFLTARGWVIPVSAEAIVGPLFTVIGIGASIFAIVKRIKKPVNAPILPNVLPNVKPTDTKE